MWTWFVSPLLWVICMHITAWLLDIELTWRVFVLCATAAIVDGFLEGMYKE